MNSNLLAVAFDPKALRATAGPVSVVAGVLQTGAAQYAVSDSGTLAYVPGMGGEIFVRPFPGVGDGKWQLTREGGDSPLWSPDGGELFYRGGDAIMAIPVKYAPVFFDTPRMLFRGAYDRLGWDIHPVNKRFLMMKEGEPTYGKINVVLNWTEELKKKVPAK